MRVRIRLLFCGVIAFALWCVPIFACSCVSPPPELKTPRDFAKWYSDRSDAIFEGTVTHIELKSALIDTPTGGLLPVDLDLNLPQLQVTFDISRSYKRVKPGQVLVTTGLGGGDCGFDFEVGRQYLVFAFTDSSGHLSTGICSGTGLLENNQSARSYLRGEPILAETPRQHPQIPQTKLCGHVTATATDLADSQVFLLRTGTGSPMPVDGAGVAQDGSFCIDGASPGGYFLAFMSRQDDVASSFAFFPGTADPSEAGIVALATGQTRSDLIFNVPPQPAFSVSGTVATSTNSPLPHECSVFLLNTDRLSFFASYKADVGPTGAFEFRRVLPGKYWAFVGVGDSDAAPNWLTRKTEVDVTAPISNLSLELVQK